MIVASYRGCDCMVSVIVLELKGTAGCPVCPPVTILSAEMKIYKFGCFLRLLPSTWPSFLSQFFFKLTKVFEVAFSCGHGAH